MPDPKGIQSFRAFMDSVHGAEHGEFSVKPLSLVAHEDAFSEMKAHLLKHYDGIEVSHSFEDESDAVYDCIPIGQQPSLRGSSAPLPKAPDLPFRGDFAASQSGRKVSLIQSPLGLDRKDRHGNAMHCPLGTVPFRRITLETMTRFEDLRHFFRKSPALSGRPPQNGGQTAVQQTHRWAHAFQNVDNVGGHGCLNVWQPRIGAGEFFSLSQHWYIGGSEETLQTVECGWQVCPMMYNDDKPHLFVYWTADDYGMTGCYNMTASGFVQVASSFAPGMALSPPYSVAGGEQYEIELAFYLSSGCWWLYYGGLAAGNVLGYYPAAIFNGGALASQAREIDYGGEVVGSVSFPPMGSGAFANAGWQNAAYQRTIFHFPPDGGAPINADLVVSQEWPQCYTAAVELDNSPWFETLWYGGPGGNC